MSFFDQFLFISFHSKRHSMTFKTGFLSLKRLLERLVF
jgi:hypothetical protein